MPSSRILLFADPHPHQVAIRAAAAEVFVTPNGEFRAALSFSPTHAPRAGRLICADPASATVSRLLID